MSASDSSRRDRASHRVTLLDHGTFTFTFHMSIYPFTGLTRPIVESAITIVGSASVERFVQLLTLLILIG